MERHYNSLRLLRYRGVIYPFNMVFWGAQLSRVRSSTGKYVNTAAKYPDYFM
jgi:hypothetical protein